MIFVNLEEPTFSCCSYRAVLSCLLRKTQTSTQNNTILETQSMSTRECYWVAQSVFVYSATSRCGICITSVSPRIPIPCGRHYNVWMTPTTPFFTP